MCPQSFSLREFVGDRAGLTSAGLGPLQWESAANQTRTMSNPIRILVVDDHPILRQGLSALLANEPDMLLTGEASNGLEAIEQFRSLRPDIMLLDRIRILSVDDHPVLRQTLGSFGPKSPWTITPAVLRI